MGQRAWLQAGTLDHPSPRVQNEGGPVSTSEVVAITYNGAEEVMEFETLNTIYVQEGSLQ